MKRMTYLIIALMFSFTSIYAVTEVGTTSAQFLKIEVGSRASAMGGAFVGMADDATALYWNPAGSALISEKQLSTTHTPWLAETNFDFVAFAFPLRNIGTIGLSVVSLSMDDMQVRTIYEPEGTGVYFGAGDYALGLSYARRTTDRFSFGLTTKYIQQRIWLMRASSFAIDAGLLYRTEFHNLRLGMSISNFGPKLNLSGNNTKIEYALTDWQKQWNVGFIGDLRTGEFVLPLRFRTGLAMDLLVVGDTRFTVAADAVHPNDNVEYVNLGSELALKERYFLRAGYKSLFMEDSEEGLTAGGGIKYNLQNWIIDVDYAYADFGRLGFVNRISVGVGF
jgi:opacity protein-like surface antigen